MTIKSNQIIEYSILGSKFKLRKNDKLFTVDPSGYVKVHSSKPKYNKELKLWESSNSKIVGVIEFDHADHADLVDVDKFSNHLIFSKDDLYITSERISDPDNTGNKRDISRDIINCILRVIKDFKNGQFDDIIHY